jgi:hypothetical protein
MTAEWQEQDALLTAIGANARDITANIGHIGQLFRERDIV